MTALMEPISEEAPAYPITRPRRGVLAGDPSRVVAIVFELDTLYDSELFETARARAIARLIAERRGTDPLWLEILAVQMARREGGRKTSEALQTLVGIDTEPMLGHRALALLEPLQGVEGLLDTLRKDFKLAVVSSRSQRETTHILTALGLYDHFDAGVFADTPGQNIDTACERAAGLLGELEHHCLVVGGSGSPILRSARLAGMRTAALRNGAFSDEIFEVDMLIDGLNSLQALARTVATENDRAAII